MARRHHEFNLAQRRTGKYCRPQLAAVGKAAIVLRSDQPVCRGSQCMCTLHQFDDVGFPVGDINQSGGRQGCCHFGDALVPFGPAQAFADPWARAVSRFGFPCPHPGIGDPQRFTFRRHRIGWMQVHAALGFVRERAEAVDALPIEVQFGTAASWLQSGRCADRRCPASPASACRRWLDQETDKPLGSPPSRSTRREYSPSVCRQNVPTT